MITHLTKKLSSKLIFLKKKLRNVNKIGHNNKDQQIEMQVLNLSQKYHKLMKNHNKGTNIS